MQGLISIPDFVAHLQAEGLVIIKAADFAAATDFAQRERRRRLMKKNTIAATEAVEAGFFPTIGTVDGLVKMQQRGIILPVELYKNSRNRWMLLSDALRRLNLYAD